MKNLFKNKWLYIGLVILFLGWFIYNQVPLKNIYLYKRGTDIPISNQPIKITYEPFCVSSPCTGPDRVYEGQTKADGSFRISLRDALKIQAGIRERYTAYYIEIDNFYHEPSTIVPDANTPFDIYLTEYKDAEEPVEVDLGQEFNLSSNLMVNNGIVLQLDDIDLDNQTVKLKLLLNSLGKKSIVTDFTLKKEVPSYIPREITDSQIVLTDLNEKQAMIKLLPRPSTQAWKERGIDFSPENEANDQRYLNALRYFNEIEKKFKKEWGQDIKLVPFDYSNSAKAIAPVDFDSRWISHGELPKVGGFCLVSSFHLDTTKEDLAEGRGTSNWIKACLPSESSVSMEKFLNY